MIDLQLPQDVEIKGELYDTYTNFKTVTRSLK